jgi:hypothetical protein
MQLAHNVPHRLEANSPEVCKRRGSAASKTRVGSEAARVFVVTLQKNLESAIKLIKC